jgi:hypothetical protein
MKLTCPPVTGAYPFKLTNEEQSRNNDNWAWSFLRLNPYYRHDFDLVRIRHGVQSHLDEARRLISHFRIKQLPPGSNPMRTPAYDFPLPTSLPDAIADLDSGYFIVDGKPIPPTLHQFVHVPTTLQEWLNNHGGIASIVQLDIREFDAPRDYGIADWIHPDRQSLEVLEAGQSWFHFINEPVWCAGTWALRPSNKPLIHIDSSGQKIIVGTEKRPEVTKEITVIQENDPEVTVKRLERGHPLPLNYHSTSSTELHFLICLDGNVEPQLAAVRPIADDLKALHGQYFHEAIAKGTCSNFVPIIKDPLDLDQQVHGILAGMFKDLTQSRIKSRKNWRAITIDVAAPMVKQFEDLKKQLIEIQDSVSGQLTFPLRKRVGRTSGDHWLKRNLSVLELYFYGFDNSDVNSSLLAMTRAFYDECDPLYLAIREETTEQSPKILLSETKALDADHPKLHLIKEALDNAKELSLAGYEFLGSLNAKKECLGINTTDKTVLI